MNESLRRKQRAKRLRELWQYQQAQSIYARQRAADAMKAYDEAIRRRDFLRRKANN